LEALEVPWRLSKHLWHAESVAGSTDNLMLSIPVAPTIGPREFGPTPAARHAQVVGETPAGVDTSLIAQERIAEEFLFSALKPRPEKTRPSAFPCKD